MADDGEDDYEYDFNDPRTREHAAYKIAQEHRGRATRRFKKGDAVDDIAECEENDGSSSSSDDYEDDYSNDDVLDEKLMNAREARGWAVDEANRRHEWNGQWTGGAHEGVEEQADARMEEVTGPRGWNDRIELLERAIAARDAESDSPDNGDDDDERRDSDEDEPDDEQENLWTDRSERERGYRYAQDFSRGHDEEVVEDEEESESVCDEEEEDAFEDSDSDSDWEKRRGFGL